MCYWHTTSSYVTPLLSIRFSCALRSVFRVHFIKSCSLFISRTDISIISGKRSPDVCLMTLLWVSGDYLAPERNFVSIKIDHMFSKFLDQCVPFNLISLTWFFPFSGWILYQVNNIRQASIFHILPLFEFRLIRRHPRNARWSFSTNNSIIENTRNIRIVNILFHISIAADS